MGLGGAGRDVPVDASYVIADGIQPRFRGIRSGTRNEALVIPLEEAIEPSVDGQVEPPQRLLRCQLPETRRAVRGGVATSHAVCSPSRGAKVG
jgi:hypothetical protein